MNIIKKTDLEPVLERHPSKHNSNDTDINYWLTKNSKHDFDENFFSEFIHSLIHQFVYRTMDHVEQSTIKKNQKKSISKFNLGKNKYNYRSGEIGELILFILLESENIYQIYSKMRLKTSQNMNVHGYDAVHFEINENNDIILHFGEAKMEKSKSSAINNALKSIDNLSSKQFELELDLIHDNAFTNMYDENISKKIRSCLNPYAPIKSDLRHSIFIGCDWVKMKHRYSKFSTIQTHFDRFDDCNNKLIDKKISNTTLKKENLKFFIMPFKNITKFKKSFIEKLRNEQ